MQDLSRDELHLMHGECDKDSILANENPSLEGLKMSRTSELESSTLPIKLEDNGDTFLWPNKKYSGSNLL